MPEVGKLLAVEDESGGNFASFWMQWTRTPGMFAERIETVEARAFKS